MFEKTKQFFFLKGRRKKSCLTRKEFEIEFLKKKFETILISSVVMPLTCDDWNALSTKYLFKLLFLTKYSLVGLNSKESV
jgi:hypothetical protein